MRSSWSSRALAVLLLLAGLLPVVPVRADDGMAMPCCEQSRCATQALSTACCAPSPLAPAPPVQAATSTSIAQSFGPIHPAAFVTEGGAGPVSPFAQHAFELERLKLPHVLPYLRFGFLLI